MFDKQVMLNKIIIPDLSNLPISPVQLAHLTNAIKKIKLDQLINLATHHILPLLQIFNDEGKERFASLVPVLLLDCFSQEQLMKIFEINNVSLQPDYCLLIKLAQLQLINEEMYQAVYKFVHQYYLDKYEHVMNNAKAFPLRISDRLLGMAKQSGHYVSRYLTDFIQDLTLEEKGVLQDVYSIENLKTKTLRRKAHEAISLSLYEIQLLIESMCYETVKLGKVPEHIILSNELFDQPNKAHQLYTREVGFNLIRQNKLEDFKEYIEKNPESGGVDGTDLHTGKSYFCYSVILQNLEVATHLVRLGADVNKSDKNGYSPLHYAVEGESPAVVELVLETFKNVDAEDRGGYTALYVAAELGKSVFIKSILEKNANPNLANNRYRSTPLHAAVRNGKLGAIRILFENKQTNIKALDSKGKTPIALANEQGLDIENLLNTKPITYNTTASHAPTFNSEEKIIKLMAALAEPRKNLAWLCSLASYGRTLPNPFVHLMPITALTIDNSTDLSFSKIMLDELAIASRNMQTFATIIKELPSNSSSPVTIYKNLYTFAKKINDEKLVFCAFALELVKLGLVQQLCNLVDDKSVLQVAIEYQDIKVIEEILEKDPQVDAPIIHKGKKYTVAEYSILIGIPDLVKKLVALSQAKPKLKLGTFPSNAIELAMKNLPQSKLTPAHQDIVNLYDINIIQASKRNVINLIRKLMRNAPAVNNIHGMFSQDEYKLFKILIAGQEEVLLSKRKAIWRTHCNSETEMDARSNLDKYLCDYIYFQPGHLQSRNIFRHGTSNFPAIKVAKKLVSTHVALTQGSISISHTPVASQKNIFFTQNSPLTEIPPFLQGNAQHIIEVNITALIKNKTLEQKDLYTSPHLSAFTIERVEQPIIFIGLDPNKKTVYRVYHGKDYKMHWFDYYQNEVLIGSDFEKTTISEEFYMGDNVKITGWRFIHFLRKLKGPFTSGSYYHFVLENYQDLTILDSAKAVRFSVLMTEAKIVKSIPIDDPGVTVIGNPKLKRAKEAEEKAKKALVLFNSKEFSPKNFAVTLASIGDCNYLLSPIWTQAVNSQNLEIFNLMMEASVPLPHDLLAYSIIKLCEIYNSKHQDINSINFQNAYKIVMLLLNHGIPDKNDPKHIRHATSVDCIGNHKELCWENTTQKDLLAIKKLIFTFKDVQIQKSILSGLTKHLAEIVDFTFNFALFDLHSILAAKDPALNQINIKVSEILDLINAEKTLDIVAYLKTLPESQVHKHYYIMTYAIQNGKTQVVLSCYDYFKNSPQKSIFPFLNLAAYFNQVGTFKKLYTLESDLKTKDILERTPIFWILRNGIVNLLDYVPQDSNNLKNIVLLLIRRHDNAKLKDFLSRYVVIDRIRAKNHNEQDCVTEFGDPQTNMASSFLKDAIEVGNLEAICLLTDKAKNSSNENFSKFLEKMAIYAAHKGRKDIFSYAIEQILVTPSAFTELFKNDSPFAANIIGTGNIASVETLFTLVPDKKMITRSQRDIYNCLQVAVKNLDKEMVKLLLEYASMPFATKKCNLSFLLRDIFINSNTDFLEFLILQGLKLNNNVSVFELLETCIIEGDIRIVRWLFEKGFITIDWRSENNDNLLQQVAKTRLNASPIDVNSLGLKIDFLISQGLDVNNQDSHGDTLIFIRGGDGTLRRCITDYLFEHPNTKLTLTNKEGHTFLEKYHPNDVTVAMIQRFIDQGGDVTAKRASCTILEQLLMKGAVNDVVKEKLNRVQVPPSDCKVVMPSLVLITCTYQNKLYILCERRREFVFCNSPTAKSLRLTTNGQSLDLWVHHLNEVKKLPKIKYDHNFHYASQIRDFPKLVGAEKSYQWIKTFTHYKADGEKGYHASNGVDNFVIGEYVKNLIEIVSLQLTNKTNVSTAKLMITPAQFRLLENGMTILEELSVTYYDLVKQKPFTENKKLISHLNGMQVSVNVYKLESGRYSTKTYSHPLQLAVNNKDRNNVQLLINVGLIDNLATYDPDSSFGIAVQQTDSEMLTFILEKVPSINSSVLIDSLEKIPSKTEYLKNIMLLLRYLSQQNFSIHIKKRLNSWLDIFTRNLGPREKSAELFQELKLTINMIKARQEPALNVPLLGKTEKTETTKRERDSDPVDSKKVRVAQPEQQVSVSSVETVRLMRRTFLNFSTKKTKASLNMAKKRKAPSPQISDDDVEEEIASSSSYSN